MQFTGLFKYFIKFDSKLHDIYNERLISPAFIEEKNNASNTNIYIYIFY